MDKESKSFYVSYLINEYVTYFATLGYTQDYVEENSRSLNKFQKFLGKRQIKYINQIDKRIVLDYIVWVNEVHKYYADTTINAMLSKLKYFLIYLLEYEYVNTDFTGLIRYRKIRRKLRDIPNQTQVKTFLETVDTSNYIGLRDRSILELFYSTGIRRAELINLNMSDIDLKNSILKVIKGKWKKDRTVPIGEIALNHLLIYLNESRQRFPDYMQENSFYLSKKGGRITKHIIARIFNKYSNKAKLNINITPHILRHSCATHMLQRGASIRYVQKLLGHEDLKTTEIYTHVLRDDIHKSHKLYHPRTQMNVKS